MIDVPLEVDLFDFKSEYELYKNDRGASSPDVADFFQDIVNNTMYSTVAYLEFVESEMGTPEEAQERGLRNLKRFLGFLRSIPTKMINPDSFDTLEDIRQRISALIDKIEDLERIKSESAALANEATEIRKDFNSVQFIFNT